MANLNADCHGVFDFVTCLCKQGVIDKHIVLSFIDIVKTFIFAVEDCLRKTWCYHLEERNSLYLLHVNICVLDLYV